MHHTGRVLLSVPVWECAGVRSPFPATHGLRGCGGAIPVRPMLPHAGRGSSDCPLEVTWGPSDDAGRRTRWSENRRSVAGPYASAGSAHGAGHAGRLPAPVDQSAGRQASTRCGDLCGQLFRGVPCSRHDGTPGVARLDRAVDKWRRDCHNLRMCDRAWLVTEDELLAALIRAHQGEHPELVMADLVADPATLPIPV